MKKNVVIIILVMLVLGLGGYLVYDKVVDKDIEKESKEETVEKEYDLEEAKKLVDSIIPGDYDAETHCRDFNNFFEMSTEDYKLLSVLYSFDEERKEEDYIDCYSLKNDICDYGVNGVERYVELDYDILNQKYHSMFGSNSNLPKKDINRPLSWYKYDNKSNKYIQLYYAAGCAGEYLPRLTIYKVESANENNEELAITIKGMVTDLESLPYGNKSEYYYLNQNYKLTKDGTEITTKDYENIKAEILEKEEDLFGTYEMTFIKENGKYYYSDMIRVY